MTDSFDMIPRPDGADPGACDESPQCQMQNVLQILNAFKLITDDCHRYGLQVVEDASTNPDHLDHLGKFLEHLHKCLTKPNLQPVSQKSHEEPTARGLWNALWPSTKAKVFIEVSGETFGASKYIKHKMKSKVDTVSNPRDCDVIVLFCPISSRIGSDVEAALKKIPESMKIKPVILVLMHHTRNIYYSPDESNWSDEYSTVVSYVHVLFHETQKGLLTCQKNDQAINTLLDQCIKHGK